jgi:hypothetical protein
VCFKLVIQSGRSLFLSKIQNTSLKLPVYGYRMWRDRLTSPEVTSENRKWGFLALFRMFSDIFEVFGYRLCCFFKPQRLKYSAWNATLLVFRVSFSRTFPKISRISQNKTRNVWKYNITYFIIWPVRRRRHRSPSGILRNSHCCMYNEIWKLHCL